MADRNQDETAAQFAARMTCPAALEKCGDELCMDEQRHLTRELEAREQARDDENIAMIHELEDTLAIARGEETARADFLSRVVTQGMLVPTLAPGEAFAEPTEHKAVSVALEMHEKIRELERRERLLTDAGKAWSDRALAAEAKLALVESRLALHEPTDDERAFWQRMFRRKQCGCFAADCTKHGAYDSVDVRRAMEGVENE